MKRVAEVSRNRVERILNVLSRVQVDANRSAIVMKISTFADPSQTSEGLEALNAELLAEFKFRRRGIAAYLRVPAANMFYVRLDSLKRLNDIVNLCDVFLLIEIAIFRIDIVDVVIKCIKQHSPNTMPVAIEEDKDHFIYGIDFDNHEVDTGITEYISIGKIPKELRVFFG